MRKTACLAIALIVLYVSGCKKEEPVVRQGIINFLAGTVTLLSGDKKSPASAGDIINQGMKIETGRNSFVEIYFGENAVKIMENSAVEVTVLITEVNKSEKTEIQVENGRVFSRVMKKLAKDDQYRVKTPTAVASIRGTDFMVEEKDGKGTVSCVDGKVRVSDTRKSEDEGVDIKAGEMVNVEPGKQLTVVDITEQNRRNLEDIRNSIQELKQDIREKFEKQKEEIKKAVKDLKESNKAMVEDQKAKDRENIENIKSGAREEMKKIKDDTATAKDKATEEANLQKDKNKGLVESVKKPTIEKPDIKKFNTAPQQ